MDGNSCHICRMEPETILDVHYDKWHRGRLMAENGKVFNLHDMTCGVDMGRSCSYFGCIVDIPVVAFEVTSGS